MSKVADLRKAAGLTQRQLADAIGVTESTIRNLENNRNGVEHLVRVARLCDVLSCRAQELVGFVDPGATDEPEQPSKRSKGKVMQRESVATVATGKAEFNPGDCCKMPSGARVFIDRRLDDGRYAVTWESTGDDDVVPAHLLTFVCHAK